MSLLIAWVFLFYSAGIYGVAARPIINSAISTISRIWRDDYVCDSLYSPSWTVDPQPSVVTTYSESRYVNGQNVDVLHRWHGPYTKQSYTSNSRRISRDFSCNQLSSVSISFFVATCGTQDHNDNIELNVMSNNHKMSFSVSADANPTPWRSVPTSLTQAAPYCNEDYNDDLEDEWYVLEKLKSSITFTMDAGSVFKVIFQFNIGSNGHYFALRDIGITCDPITTQAPETTTTSTTTTTTTTTTAPPETTTTAQPSTTGTDEPDTTTTTATEPPDTTTTAQPSTTGKDEPDATTTTATASYKTTTTAVQPSTAATTATNEPDTTTTTQEPTGSTTVTTTASEDATTSRNNPVNEARVVEETSTSDEPEDHNNDSNESRRQRGSEPMISGLLAGDVKGNMLYVIIGGAFVFVLLCSVIFVCCRMKRKKSAAKRVQLPSPKSTEDGCNDDTKHVQKGVSSHVYPHGKKGNQSVQLQIAYSPKQQNIYAVDFEAIHSMSIPSPDPSFGAVHSSDMNEGDYVTQMGGDEDADSDDDVIIGMPVTRGGDECNDEDEEDEYVPPPPEPPSQVTGYDQDGDLIAGPQTTGGRMMRTAGGPEDEDEDNVPPPPVPPVPHDEERDGTLIGNTAGQ